MSETKQSTERAIEGTVNRGGEPLGGAYVRLVGPSEEFVAEIYTKDDGRFAFHVVDGEWRLEVRAAGSETVTRPVAVAGGPSEVSIDL